jgi:hypothetical protein
MFRKIELLNFCHASMCQFLPTKYMSSIIVPARVSQHNVIERTSNRDLRAPSAFGHLHEKGLPGGCRTARKVGMYCKVSSGACL